MDSSYYICLVFLYLKMQVYYVKNINAGPEDDVSADEVFVNV